MGYSKDIYKKALQMKLNETAKANAVFERKKALVYSQNSRLAEIDALLLKLGPQIGLAAMSGDNFVLEELKQTITSLSNEKKKLLEKAGLNESQATCPKCKDSGYIGGKLCSCVLEVAKGLAFSTLSDKMPIENSRFDNFNLKYYSDEGENPPRKSMSKILALCENYAKNFTRDSENLLFIGATGIGKTHLSLAIARAVTEKGYGVIYASAENLFRTLSKEYFNNDNNSLSMESVLSCDLLLLDDLGSEFSTAFSTSCVYNLINTRLLTSLPTIISTNLTLAEIETKYTPRVSSRLFANYIMKRFAGTDIRQQKSVNKRGY